MTDNQKNQIRKLRASGNGYGKIAETLGISVNTVKSFCRRNELCRGNNIAARAEQPPENFTGETTVCENCGREIRQIAKRKKKRFCCDKCRNAWWNSHLDQVKRTAVYHIKCQHCGKNSRFTETGGENTAAMNAILLTGLKAVTAMNEETFRDEKLYQTTMLLARKMLREGIISEVEYRQIDTIFLEKYRPVFGTLFSDIALTSGQ